MDERIRINKITAVFNDADGVTITLYKTHDKLGQLTSDELGIPKFSDSKTTNKNAYMVYCKEFVTNLLENGGVEGYYYDPVNHADQATNGIPKKFDNTNLAKCGMMILGEKLDEAFGGIADYGYEIDPETIVDVTERYKDGYIKYGKAPYQVKLTGPTNSTNIVVPIEVKSGQLCKPKTMLTNDQRELAFNITNIKSLIGGTLKPQPSKPTVGIVGQGSNLGEAVQDMCCRLSDTEVPGAVGSMAEPIPNLSTPAPEVKPDWDDSDLKPEQSAAKEMLEGRGIDPTKVEPDTVVDNKSSVSRLMDVFRHGSHPRGDS